MKTINKRKCILFWEKYGKKILNKYTVALVVFGVYYMATEEYNLFSRVNNERHITQLKEENSYYQKQIQENRQKIQDLKSDKESLERHAREQYFMKRDNEDVFIVR